MRMITRRSTLSAAATALAFGPQTTRAQDASGVQLLFREARYLPGLLELRAQRGPMLPQYAAFVGDETEALASAAQSETSESLSPDARASDAIDRIVDAAADRKIVILNEAHTASRHRSFLARVLRALRPVGFTHLACGNFLNTNDEDAPDIRRYTPGTPFNPDYGFYTKDPVFAEAVREAADLGYRFVRFEMRSDQRGPDNETQAQSIARRDEALAENFIAEALHQAKDRVRVLAYHGYAHIRETPHNGSESFASRLARKTGIDPLTIEQSLTGSFGPHADDSDLTRSILARFSPEKPIIVEQSGAVVGAARMSADLAVFHPSLPDMHSRPGWLAADPARRLVHVDLPRGRREGLALAQALHAHEPERAVPADHYLIAAETRRAAFFLRPGRYRVRLETLAGFQGVREIVV